MPISHYYSGKGRKVMRAMKARYGLEKGERVFYATANKKGQTPQGEVHGDFMDLARRKRKR